MNESAGPELRRKRTHEVVTMEAGDAAARLFAASHAATRTGICLWICGGRMPALCPHGLHGLLDPDTIIVTRVATSLDGLWTAEEALRSEAVATVVLESDQRLDLRQSRRLQFAAEAGNATGLFLGPDSGNTAAETRWLCRAVRSDGSRTICFDWKQLKNKRGANIDWKASRNEATGIMRVVATSRSGAGVEERPRSGSYIGHRGRGTRRLETLLA